jgi:hypothetical protein
LRAATAVVIASSSKGASWQAALDKGQTPEASKRRRSVEEQRQQRSRRSAPFWRRDRA